MRVAIATARVPFARGAPERLASALQGALLAAGHEADILAIPFSPSGAARIPGQMLACRLMQAAESSGVAIDRLVGLAFPATLIPHPAKRLWLETLYRPAYDGWDRGELRQSAGGAHVRQAIVAAEAAALAEAVAVHAVSAAASAGLHAQAGIDAPPLYHPPPHAERFTAVEWGDAVLVPDDGLTDARHGPVLDALALTREPVRACFIGGFASAEDERLLRSRGAGSEGRLDWRGPVDGAERVDLFARCLAVIALAPGYGYGALEAMLSGKAVVAGHGAAEFVVDGETGFACEPADMADRLDLLWANRTRAAALGRAGRAHYGELGVGWDRVIECLLG